LAPRTTAWGAYRSIAAAIRARIIDGEFPPGSVLPSETTLCGQYEVSRNTVRRALEELASDGLLAAQPGRGRVVLAEAAAGHSPIPQYRSMANELRALIESGELAPGDPVPSESVLAGRYGVARGTARHALAELEGAGLIKAIHGKGRFVQSR
jgi:DNA-binding GntR family transcriptional regulator